MSKKKILITSALPYANGPLHFGHIAGAYLPGDVYARFERLMGHDVLYICGSDEHGVAITLSAEMAGRTPKEHVDLFHAINKIFFQQLEISFDHYSRTTWPGHVATTQQFFQDLLAGGYIEDKVTDQLYSEREQKFLADRYVVGICPKCGFEEARGDECQRCGASYEAVDLKTPRSKLTGSPLVLKPTRHWFLRFDLFKEKLAAFLADRPQWKPNILKFAKHYVEQLRPRAITRDADWGIPVPLQEAEGKVFYVWFDAPIGYISATKEWAQQRGTPDVWKDYWCDPKTTLVQFIGKDNIPFHALFFPAMVMGQRLPLKLVDELPANEFYMLEGRQFSKSEGWYIDLERFFQHFTADQIRYAIAATAPETQDAEFLWKDFQRRCNADLLGKYGNLANRVLVFAANHCRGAVPPRSTQEPSDEEFLQALKVQLEAIQEAYEGFHVRRATELLMHLAHLGNTYFDHKKPWVLAKTAPAEMQTVIACCLECLKLLALASSPLIPATAQKLWEMLGYSSKLADQSWRIVANIPILERQKLPEPQILFRKIEDDLIDAEIGQLQAKKPMIQAIEIPSIKELISIDEVRKVDLRIGQILTAERVPKSKKLLKLSVDLGHEQRTIVSGIGEHYPDLSLLIGKRVIIVANLRPATLMGIESQGMLLAALTSTGIELPQLQQAPPGTAVT